MLDPARKDAPCKGEVSVAVGGLLTVIDTGADVVCAPWLSVARAVIVCAPSATFDQVKLNGAEFEAPSSAPSPKSSTSVTVPSESVAFTLTGTLAGALNTAPDAGDVMLIEGGTFGPTTVIVWIVPPGALASATNVTVAGSLNVALEGAVKTTMGAR